LWQGIVPKSIGPGDTGVVAVPEPRLLSYPLPDTITLKVACYGFNETVDATFPLSHMSHHTPDGTLPFPMRASDCASGVYLATGTNHGFGSAHGNTRQQRFAYDFHARRWNGSKLSRLKDQTDGTKPEDYLIWGQPLYAVANAKIVAAWRDRPDDGIGVDTSPGGNGFWMQLTGGDGETATFALYAHLMQGSIPEELVPVEGGPGPYVTKGQYLGLVGKSGTKEPHLHFHIQRGMSKYVPDPVESGEGLPIRFTDVEAIGFEHFDDADPDAGWKQAFASGIGENCLVKAEAPEWVGPIETTGMGQPHGGLASTNWNDPGFLPLDPGTILRGR
ncbi:MAG: M23 family metallopeptidase, partial [Tepidiformaceae bacterium]